MTPVRAADRHAGPVLEVDGLHVCFDTDQGEVHAVNGVSYHLDAGEVLAIVGESGSGKTVGSLAVMGLLPANGSIRSGQIRLAGQRVPHGTPGAWSAIRGRRVAMVFQDPMTSLNPVLSVGRQMSEGLMHHFALRKSEAWSRATSWLERVGIPEPAKRMKRFPHEFSGGQRQRVMIAMALACEPDVLIADEPTTALDVTVQAQIIDLVDELRTDLGMGVLWITHDLALVSGFADRVGVMYAGRLVEEGAAAGLFERPAHPYTVALLESIPSGAAGSRLHPIQGHPPSLSQLPRGCAFAPRCAWAVEVCRATAPEPVPVSAEPPHGSACHRATEAPWKGTAS